MKTIAAAHHKGKPRWNADCQLLVITVMTATASDEINVVMCVAVIAIFLRMIVTTLSVGRTA